MIRKATVADIEAVCRIYDDIHTAEETGQAVIGWDRAIYPTRKTAEDALLRGDLFVQEGPVGIVGTGIINQVQVDVYAGAPWKYLAEPEQVMVLHTLVISPQEKGRGYGREFADFYEAYAEGNRCTVLRIDTNAKNAAARALYRKLGYREAGIVPCVFNGLEGVNLVLLEKPVGQRAE